MLLLFKSKDTAVKSGAFESVQGKGIEIEGTVRSKGSIRIDGKIKGKVQSGADVMIGEGAIVDADIEGNNVTIAGRVSGNVKTTGRLELLSTGRLKGDVISGSLVVSEGARFSGSSAMTEAAEPGNKVPAKQH